MDLFSSFFVALLISMLLTPLLMRVSPRLHLMDYPGERKVHAVDVPRVGGIAIAIGAITPVLIWLPVDTRLTALLAGGMVLLLFGLLDDRIGLGYGWKFVGQLLAAAIAMWGGLLIRFVPFGGLDPISLWISVPLTALFLVGVTNAVNLSDGLDGLAAGVSLITLGGIGWLAFQAGAFPLALVVLALIGGICGFLRYNDYPAVVFMGDSGSQFLGFMTATLTLILTQQVHQALSPALLLMLLGVPILDTLTVMVWRMRAGVSPFHADNRHFHHRLLDLGFRHHEAVATIYAVHALLVMLAVVLRYEADLIVMLAYCVCSAAILAALRLARVSGWRLRSTARLGQLVRRRPLLRHFDWLPGAIAAAVAAGMAAFLLVAVLFQPAVGSKLAWLVTAAGAALAVIWITAPVWRLSVQRAAIYLASVVSVHALAVAGPFPVAEWIVNLWTVLLAGLVIVGMRIAGPQEVSASPLDLLIVFVLLALLLFPVLSAGVYAEAAIGLTAVRFAVLYYGAEVLLGRAGPMRDALAAVAAASLAVFAVRGLL